MANNGNLRRLSPSEAREYGRRGGKASGESRRRKADFRKTLNALLTAEIDNPEWTPLLEALGWTAPWNQPSMQPLSGRLWREM